MLPESLQASRACLPVLGVLGVELEGPGALHDIGADFPSLSSVCCWTAVAKNPQSRLRSTLGSKPTLSSVSWILIESPMMAVLRAVRAS